MMKMPKLIRNWKLTGICVLAMAVGSTAGPTRAAFQPALATISGAELTSELQTLDTYVGDLITFNKKCAGLSKKESLTGPELDPLQHNADDLKRRLSSVQNVLQDMVRKLKAADEWKDLDAKVLATITDAKVQAQFRETSFKQELENAASQLSNNANEISKPVEALRRKVAARSRDGVVSQDAQFHVVQVAYNPGGPTVKLISLGCSLANLRLGMSGFVRGRPTGNAYQNQVCACAPDLDPDGCLSK